MLKSPSAKPGLAQRKKQGSAALVASKRLLMTFTTARLFVGTTLRLRITSLGRKGMFVEAARLTCWGIAATFLLLYGMEVDNLVLGI